MGTIHKNYLKQKLKKKWKNLNYISKTNLLWDNTIKDWYPKVSPPSPGPELNWLHQSTLDYGISPTKLVLSWETISYPPSWTTAYPKARTDNAEPRPAINCITKEFKSHGHYHLPGYVLHQPMDVRQPNTWPGRKFLAVRQFKTCKEPCSFNLCLEGLTNMANPSLVIWVLDKSSLVRLTHLQDSLVIHTCHLPDCVTWSGVTAQSLSQICSSSGPGLSSSHSLFRIDC